MDSSENDANAREAGKHPAASGAGSPGSGTPGSPGAGTAGLPDSPGSASAAFSEAAVPPPGSVLVPSVFPSGRQLRFKVGERTEELELRSPTGDVELSIQFTDQGPVVRLRGAKLVLDSTEKVSIHCRALEFNATDGVQFNVGSDFGVRSQREIRLKSGRQTFIDGDYLNLNCLDRTGYHDEGVEYASAAEELPEGTQTRELSPPASPLDLRPGDDSLEK